MSFRQDLRSGVVRLFPAPAAWVRRRRALARATTDTRANVAHLATAVDDLTREFHDWTRLTDGRLTLLRRLVAQVEPYQPLYGVSGIVEQPARTSVERARAIETSMGETRGRRILDIGSSFGYMCYYFADRSAVTTGWEVNPANTEIAREVGNVTGIPATFLTRELNLDTVRGIVPGAYDCAFVLAVFHHVIHFQGLEAAQQIVAELVDRIPVLYLELASRGEDPALFWDAAQPADPLTLLDLVKDRVEITCLGEFDTHLSTKTRPIYRVARPRIVRVGDHDYAYDTMTNEAYQDSPIAAGPWRRAYYHSSTHVIKEYVFGTSESDNWRQILGELYIHALLERGRSVHHALVVDDVDLDRGRARVAIRKVEGTLLSELAPLGDEKLRDVVRDTLMTLADLRDRGLHHNDVRSWNIVVGPDGGWLIDYGRVAHEAVEDDVVALAWAAVAGARGGREPATEPKLELPDLHPLAGTRLSGLVDALLAGERDPRVLLGTL